jgi:hypothetical protein
MGTTSTNENSIQEEIINRMNFFFWGGGGGWLEAFVAETFVYQVDKKKKK